MEDAKCIPRAKWNCKTKGADWVWNGVDCVTKDKQNCVDQQKTWINGKCVENSKDDCEKAGLVWYEPQKLCITKDHLRCLQQNKIWLEHADLCVFSE